MTEYRKSRYRGVYEDSWRSWKWKAQIYYRGKTLFLGYFTEEIDAAKAYDQRAYELFGKQAKLNFPQRFDM